VAARLWRLPGGTDQCTRNGVPTKRFDTDVT
jgi:hypothetical protein